MQVLSWPSLLSISITFFFICFPILYDQLTFPLAHKTLHINMSAGRAVQTFGLQVPAGDEPTPIVEFGDYPATIRLTMAALDPTEKIDSANADDFKGAVLRIIRLPEEDEDDEDDVDDMAHLLDEEDSEEDDVEAGDAMSSKASKVAALKAAINGDSMDVDGAASKEKKGKKAAAAVVAAVAATAEKDEDEDEDDDDDDDDDDDAFDSAAEEFVLCTLDTKQVRVLMTPCFQVHRN